jgi:hypothetical protein
MKHIIRAIFKCWIRVRNSCRRRPKTTQYKTSWTMLYKNGSFALVDSPTFIENTIMAFETVTRVKPSGQIDIKTAVHHKNKVSQFMDPSEIFDHTMPPWLMISCNGEDYTDALHPYICKGNTITLQMLNMLFQKGDWTYMNPKTFEEEDFPSEGIVIS